MNLLSISDKEFKRDIRIRFDNILEGLDKYPNGILTVKERKYKNNITRFLERLFIENNSEVIVDFYIKNLTKEEIKNLRENLNEKDKIVLSEFLNEIDFNTIYFEILDISLIEFFSNISINEVFFTTFYFKSLDITIWGNYNLQFPIFASEQSNLDSLQPLLQEYKLKLI